ncbi:MAG: hypothetical protein ABS75_24755 [Pelagibacterium sp. SCN 63-23]|nr:MAG: hypothetical protein ABS75_24755 [Pelagibacterium sp. SCN 63-23]
MPELRRFASNFGGIALILALLFAVTLLPPDNSLRDARASGALRVCVPPVYAPLVTGDPERPGIDIELLRALAERLDLRLVLAGNPAMGRDFNPRNWGLNRAQCQVIAGGVVDSPQTRSFLSTGPQYAETGWALVAPQRLETLRGRTIGTLALVSGLDRIGLASFLRAQGATVRVAASVEALVAGIEDRSLDAGITEALLAGGLAEAHGWEADWVAPELTRYHLVFGLWKGDLTLKRAIDEAFVGLAADGTIASILDRYGIVPIEAR